MFEDILNLLKDFAQVFYRMDRVIYLVGGAVRNRLLELPVTDYDFATNASPEEVKKLFPKVINTGIQHGTVTVLFRGLALEITTFRTDGHYVDHRHPKGVVFTSSLEADLMRRDFTINALAIDLRRGQVIDLVEGQKDLQLGVLRAIGDPNQRFNEDALRVLRLFRFASQLGFSIDEATRTAARNSRDLLWSLSRERIRDEMLKTLAGKFIATGWTAWQEDRLLNLFIPSWKDDGLSPVAIAELGKVPPRWRFIFCTVAVAGFSQSLTQLDHDLRNLAFSNHERQLVIKNIEFLRNIPTGPAQNFVAKKLIQARGDKHLGDFLIILKALARIGAVSWSIQETEHWIEIFQAISRDDCAIFVRELAIDGDVIKELNIPPSPIMGKLLQMLLEKVWLEPSLNTQAELKAIIPELYDQLTKKIDPRA